MGKGENAGNQHFLPFPLCFLPIPNSKVNFCFLVTFVLSSAHAFNLDQSKILSFGKELTIYHTIQSPQEKCGKRVNADNQHFLPPPLPNIFYHIKDRNNTQFRFV